jgi:uncharacterized OsmC-like protein
MERTAAHLGLDDRSDGTGIVGTPKMSEQALEFTMATSATTIPGEPMLKMAWFGDHEVFCDEGPVLGGHDEFPPPLGYMAMALAFCTLTQLTRIGHMRGLDITKAECTVEMDWWSTGSLAHGTAKTGCRGVRSRFAIESTETPETIAAVIREAKDGCYVENLIRTGATIDAEINLNGVQIDTAQP